MIWLADHFDATNPPFLRGNTITAMVDWEDLMVNLNSVNLEMRLDLAIIVDIITGISWFVNQPSPSQQPCLFISMWIDLANICF